MILPKLLGGALAAALLLAPAAQAEVLDPVDGFHVAALEGTRMWNHVDADGYFSLVDGAGNVLAKQSHGDFVFDVALGTDNDGQMLAVYSRCVNVVTCTLYAYNVDTATEHSLGIKGNAPSLDDGVLAFARGRNVYVGRLGTTPRKIAHINGSEITITDVANSSRGVAFVVDDNIHGESMYFKPDGGGALRRLAFHRWGDQDPLFSTPVWHRDRLYWAVTDQAPGAPAVGWVIRYTFHRRTVAAPVSPGSLDSIAFDGDTLITSVSEDGDANGAGQVATLDAPRWGRVPALAGLGR
jgi:hypothetical protein